MTFKAMILPDGTLRLVTPVDLKKSVGEKITIELVGIAEEEQFFSVTSLPVLKEIGKTNQTMLLVNQSDDGV